MGSPDPEELVVFSKTPDSIGQTLTASHAGDEIHFEAELCFSIKNSTLLSPSRRPIKIQKLMILINKTSGIQGDNHKI